MLHYILFNILFFILFKWNSPSRSWGLLRPMAMLITVALCLLFLDAQRRREFPFHSNLYTIHSIPSTKYRLSLYRFFYKRKFRLELFCRLCFDILNCIGNCNSWKYHDYHVNMILSYIKLYYLDIGIRSWDMWEYLLRIFLYSFCKDFSPISRYPDEVVFRFIDSMGTFSKSHASLYQMPSRLDSHYITRQESGVLCG